MYSSLFRLFPPPILYIEMMQIETNLEGVVLSQILPMPFPTDSQRICGCLWCLFWNQMLRMLPQVSTLLFLDISDLGHLKSNTKVPQWIERPQLVKMAQAVPYIHEFMVGNQPFCTHFV